MVKDKSILDPTANLNISKNAQGIVVTARTPTAPDLDVLPSQRVAKQQALEERRGSYTPSAIEVAQVSEGSDTGFFGQIGRGFDQGFLGRLLETHDSFDDIHEMRKFEQSADNYSAKNPWSAFAGQMLGRTFSDSPIDFAVGLGATAAGKFLVRAGRTAAVSQRAIDKIDDARQGLAKLFTTPEADLSLVDTFKRQAIEGMFAGAISEVAIQQMGAPGGAEEIFQATLMDATGGAILGTALRAGINFFDPKVKEDIANSLAETTGLPKNDFVKAITKTLEQRGAEINAITAARRIDTESKIAQEDALLNTLNQQERFPDARADATPETLSAMTPEDRASLNVMAELNARRTQPDVEAVQRDLELQARDEDIRATTARSQEARARFQAEDSRARLAKRVDPQGKVRAETNKKLQEIARITATDQQVVDQLTQGLTITKAMRSELEAEATKGGTPAVISKLKEYDRANDELMQKLDDLAESDPDILDVADRIVEAETPTEALRLVKEYEEARDLELFDPRTDEEKYQELARQIESGDIEVPVSSKDIPQGDGFKVESRADLIAMGRFFKMDTAYTAMLVRIMEKRAKLAGKSIDDYLADKAIRYRGSNGKSEVVFNEGYTLINAARNSKNVTQFFHEIGHIIEQDLTLREREVLAKQYLKVGEDRLTENVLFGRAFSERFANDFLTYLDDVVKGRSSEFSPGLKGVFNKIAEWLRDVGRTLFRKDFLTGPMNAETRQVFDRLFRSNEIAPLELDRRTFTQAGRRARRARGVDGADRLDETSASFQRWFGDSKVVDADGKPLVVYHGTKADFDTFDVNAAGKGDWAGIFVTPEESYAKWRVKHDGSANIMQLYAKAEKPLDLSMPDSEWNALPKEIKDAVKAKDVSLLKSKGYDSVIIDKPLGREYILFEPTQIKSVFNEGTFDPTNPNILKATGTAEANRLLIEEQTIISERAAKINEEALQAQKEIEAAETSSIGKYWAGLKKLPGFLGASIMTPETLFRNLGPTMSNVYDRLRDAVGVEAKIQHKFYKILQKANKDTKFTSADKVKISSSKAMLAGKEREFGEILNLHLNANDKGQHSAYEAIKANGYKFKGEDKATKIDEELLDNLASEEYLGAKYGPEMLRAAQAIKQTLKETGKEYNTWYKSEFGEDAFDVERNYYPKRAKAARGEGLQGNFLTNKAGKLVTDEFGNPIDLSGETEEQLQKIFEGLRKSKSHLDKRMILRTLAETTSTNRARKGLGLVEFQDPFDATIRYMNQQARLQGLGNPLAEAQLMVSALEPDIRAALGTNYIDEMKRTLNRAAGSIDQGDPIAGSWANALYKGQVLSSLSWNLSTPLKQIPSFIMAMARLDLPEGMSGKQAFFKYIQGAMKKTEEGKLSLHEDMLERFPTYAIRYYTSGQSPDLSDVNLSDAFHHISFGDAKITDAVKADGLLGGGKNFVEKGMMGIREMDAVAIRAIYLAVQDSMKLSGKLDGLDAKAADDLIEIEANRIIDETQPTYHPLSRTGMQNSRNFFARQFAMFSSQPVKNFNMMLRDITALPGLTGKEREAAKARLKTTSAMLAWQSASIAAAGMVAGKVKQEVFDAMKDEDAIAQRDAYLKSHGLEMARYWSEAFRGTFGNIPVTGGMLSELLQRATVGDGFDMEVMPIGFINDMYQFIETARQGGDLGRQTMKIATELSKMYGVPAPVVQTIKAASTNL